MDRIIQKSKWAKRKKGLMIAGGILLVGLLVFGFLAKTHASKLNVNKETLTLDTVKMGLFEEFIPIDGTVQPLKTVFINSAEGGTVSERLKEEGSSVIKGEPILKLSNSDLQLEFMNKEALLLDQMNNMRNTRISLEQNYLSAKQQLLDAQHSYIEAKRTYDRNKVLYREKTIATADFEKSEDSYNYLLKKQGLLENSLLKDSIFKISQISQLESSIKLIQQNLEMVKQSLDNLTIKAPVSGQITSLNAEIGDNKQKGQNLGEIDVQEGFKVTANVDEHYINRITKGLTAIFTFDDKEYKAVINKVLPQVTNGQFKIEMAFEGNIPSGIKQGQTIQMRLSLSKKEKTLMVKNGSFYSKTGGSWIYVLKNNEAIKRNIKLGRQNPDYYEVTGGLNEGDIVLISSYETYGNVDELILKN